MARPKNKTDRYRRKASEKKDEDWRGLDFEELVTLACEIAADANPPSQIKDLLKSKHGIVIRRELAWHLLSYAAVTGWIEFRPPIQHELSAAMKQEYPWVKELIVAHTSAADGVARHAAEALMGIVRGSFEGRSEVHIGFAGGYTMQMTARYFANLLASVDTEQIPKKFVIHTMLAGFNDDPTLDPISFCSYFQNPAILVEVKYVVLHAPAIVNTGEFQKLKMQPQIHLAIENAKALDIIVTSLSNWNDPEHNLFNQLMLRHDAVGHALLSERGCVGDMFCRPLGADGPLSDEGLNVRTLTMMDLEALPAFIRDGQKRVLLVCGMCHQCHDTRAEILGTIMNYREHIFSDLVVNSRAARQLHQQAVRR